MLGPRGVDRAIPEDLVDPRDGRPVAVGIGVVVTKVNLRSRLDQSLDQGHEALGRGVIDDDHSTASDTGRESTHDRRSGRDTLGGLEGLAENEGPVGPEVKRVHIASNRRSAKPACPPT